MQLDLRIADGFGMVGMPPLRDFVVPFYAEPLLLPGQTIKAREEIAARLLSLSIWEKRWVGTTWRDLLAIMMADCAYRPQYLEARAAHYAYMARLRSYKRMRLLTLGLWSIWHKSPQEIIQPAQRAPQSLVYEQGAAPLWDALQQLVAREYVVVAEDGTGQAFYFLTPLLVRAFLDPVARANMNFP